jgi:PAS domain S-box-containing protein
MSDVFDAFDRFGLAGAEVLQAAFVHAPLGMALVAMDGRVLLTNPVLRRMLGYDGDQTIEHGLGELLSPDDWHTVQQTLSRAGHTEPLQIETHCHRKNGNELWASLNLHVQRDRLGTARAILVYAQDITERRLAEETFQENEEKFRIAFEHSPFGMSLFRTDGTYIAVNPAVCRMFGYSKEELLSGSIRLVTHPDDIERGAEWIRKCLADEPHEEEFEKRFIHKDGHVMWGLVTSTWLRDAKGKPRMSVSHVRDITFRKQAELALRESEARLREAHEISRMGHWHWTPATNLMSWSPGIYPLLGLQPDGTTPTLDAFLAPVHAEDRAIVVSTLAQTAASGQPCDFVFRLDLRDEGIRHVRALARPGLSAKANEAGITGVLQDVTAMVRAEEERRRLEAQLSRAQRMEAIGQLAGGVAHDFNNLLTAIDANAVLAQRSLEATAPTASNLVEIRKAVTSAAHLIRQLLAFSRKQTVAPKVLDLNGAVHNVAQMLTRLLGNNLRLSIDLDDEIGRVRMDPGQLDQIIVNLAVNARDAMVGGGMLTIRTAAALLDDQYCQRTPQVTPGHYVLLSVSDTGVGMTPEVKSHIFEPFFTTKEVGRGTGLGLAMVYGAVKQHGGHIEVISEPHQGSTFNVYLPRVAEAFDPGNTDVIAANRRGSEGILLVEDDTAIRNAAHACLSAQGYRVSAFADGDAALTAFGSASRSVALLITDVIMPGINGHDLAAACVRQSPRLKVLLTSGYAQPVVDPSRLGAFELLAKPYTLDQLERTVRELLDRPERPADRR